MKKQFKVTGICPINRNIFKEEEYAPVNITEDRGNHEALPNHRTPPPTERKILVKNVTNVTPPHRIGQTSSPKPGPSGLGSKKLSGVLFNQVPILSLVWKKY